MSNVMIRPVEREVYSKHYQLESPSFSGDTVYVYAECYKNPQEGSQNEYYMLDIYFSVGDYAIKDHLIGLCFGNGPMSKADIDQEINGFVELQINDLFVEFVHAYIEKEEMWENELLRRDL